MFKFFKKLKRKKLLPIEKHLGWEAAANRHFVALLQDISEQDKERYFVASDERTRNLVRGAWMRTEFLIKQLRRYIKMDPNERRKVEGMKFPRYD